MDKDQHSIDKTTRSVSTNSVLHDVTCALDLAHGLKVALGGGGIQFPRLI